jgi:outer membrane protein TolC
MKRKMLMMLMVCLLTLSGRAQEVYTLERCRELALLNSSKAQNSRLALEAAQEGQKEAFTKFFPSVSATGLGFGASDAMMSFPSEHGSMGMLEKGVLGAVMATQPLYAGGQIVTGNKLAKLGVEVSELQRELSEDEVVFAVEQLYWQIVALEEKSKTMEEAQTLLSRVHRDVQNALDAGLINRNDLLKVELKQNELESGKLKLGNGLRLSIAALAQCMGVSAEGLEVDRSLIENVSLAFDAQIDHYAALYRRPEYRLLEKNVQANELQLKMERGKHLPTVAVGAGWTYLNFDQGSPLAMDKNFGMLFATLSIPLSDWWGGSRAIKRQKIQVQVAQNNMRNTEELLLIEMQQLRNDVEEAAQQVRLADRAIAAAIENVRLNSDYYQAGTGLLADLLEAQSNLQQARDQRTEAVTVYCVKLLKYRQTVGLERAKNALANG